MSHECPRCSQWCYCDGEDSPSRTDAWVARYCIHVCEQDQDDDWNPDDMRPDDDVDRRPPAPRCSDTCDGPGPDVVDQGPDPADSIAIPCTTCGRREPPTPPAPVPAADPAPYGEGSLSDRLCVQCGQREWRKGRRRSPACRICDRDNKRLKRRARAALNAAQGTWVVLRHDGRPADDWHVVGRVASEERARATYRRLHETMCRGGVRLLSPEGKIAASEWAPRMGKHG